MILNFIVGACIARPQSNAYNKTKTLYVILSAVEVFSSEERGKTEEQRDDGIS